MNMERKVKPILFSAPMVRALIDGRKTQTRRIIKPQPGTNVTSAGVYARSGEGMTDEWCWLSGDPRDSDTWVSEGEFKTGYRLGDLLWVRERFAPDGTGGIRYAATDDIHELRRLKPSIHMPRWASRITLEVTDIHVERLQEISKQDALAEGIKHDDERGGYWCADGASVITGATPRYIGAKGAFKSLWQSINGNRPGAAWDDNPWVVVVTFKVHAENVNDILRARGREWEIPA